MNDAKGWLRHITPTMHRLSGGRSEVPVRQVLDRLVEAGHVSGQDLEAFYRWLQAVEQELATAKRTLRMFPGGPSIRM